MSREKYMDGWLDRAIQFCARKYLDWIIFIFLALFSVLIVVPYSLLSKLECVPLIREKLYCIFPISGSETDYKQVIAVGTLLNAVLSNSYDNILKSKSQRIHGFLYADLHRRTHKAAHFLRFNSIYLILITVVMYIQGKTLRMLLAWLTTAFITCILLLLSFYATQAGEASAYRELDRSLKRDFLSQTDMSWKSAMMRSMEFTLIHPDCCALTDRNDLEFFSQCLIHAWKQVRDDGLGQLRLLAMEYEILWHYLSVNTRIQKNDSRVSCFISLLNCADNLKAEIFRKAANAENDDAEAYTFYLYSIFLFAFIHLVEEKRWSALAQVVNHAPTMPLIEKQEKETKKEKKTYEQYSLLRMLTVLVCVCEGHISESYFEHIDYSVLHTIRYSRGMDLSSIWRFITAESPLSNAQGKNLYELGWVIYRQFCWKGDA